MNDSSKLNALWIIILPLVLGFSSGRLADAVIGYALDTFSGTGGQTNAAVTAARNDAKTSAERRSLDVFLSSNPFGISAKKDDTPPPEPPKPQTPAPQPPEQPDTKLAGLTIRGTMPGIGIWYDMNNKLDLLLIGDEIERCKLVSVSYNDATFKDAQEHRITKYIIFGPVAEPPKAPTPAPAPQPAPQTTAAPPKQTGNIVAAGPDQEGQISSELVSNLVQNPFDELKRIRMRPNEKAGGLEVQWIQNDSLLKRLGVQRGDIIRSVNGIPFTNMGDIANSINSLMSSERFDVEVTRGGQNTALRYVVK